MANHALAVLENALRARKLDRTLTSAIPPGKGDGRVAPTTIAGLDACLDPTAHAYAAGTTGDTTPSRTIRATETPAEGGGLPRGQLSDIAGPQSSGRTTLLLQVLAAATRRGEIAALVDTFDRLDLASVVAAGIDLDRLLWIRGHAITNQRPPRHADPPCLRVSVARNQSGLLDRTIERALKALNLVLQAGGFGVVALDLADASPAALHRIPFTTWLRVQRTIEGSDTACVLVAPQPLARSAGGVTLVLNGRTQWAGQPTGPQACFFDSSSSPGSGSSAGAARGAARGAVSSRSHRLAGLDVTVRVVSPRRRVDGDVEISAVANESR